MSAGLVLVVGGSRAGAPLRLSIAGAAVAAATAFLVDDPAATTLAASPCSLAGRRRRRVALAILAAGSWWAAAAPVATRLAGPFPLRVRSLELGVLVVVALAASAVASRSGDANPGGIAGAVVAVAAHASTYLPAKPWLPFLPMATAPGASARLLVTLVLATALLVLASGDPARPQGRRALRSPARVVNRSGTSERQSGRGRSPGVRDEEP